MAFDTYLDEYAPDCFQFKEGFDTQRKVKDHFDHFTENHQQNDFNNWVRGNLYRLHSEVILIPAENESDAYNPGIAFHSTFSYRELDEHTQNALDRIYSDYFYIRHNDYWRNSAMQKLPEIKSATNMLVCGEDLGMVPACVPGVMNELNLLSLAIQRMPGNNREFWYPADTPYLSVTTTGSHDMPTLREWWQQNPDRSQRFFNHMLGREGAAPYYCETEIAQDIISQHMHSPSMWAIFPIQDLLAMDENLRRELPEEERINDPAIAEYYWRYRLHLNMEELLVQHDFNNELGRLIKQGGRATQY
jgi:4-alpha-glucanotransferase